MQSIICYVAAANAIGALRNRDNSLGAPAPVLTAGVPVLLKLRLFPDVGVSTPYPLSDLSEISGWSFELDSDYDGGTTCKIVADNAEITAATVTEDGALFTEVAVPISQMYTEELAAVLGVKPSVTLNGELVGYNSAGEARFVVQINGFTVRNRISGLTQPTPIPPACYENIAAAVVSDAIVESGLVTSGGAKEIVKEETLSSGGIVASGARIEAGKVVSTHNADATAHATLFNAVVKHVEDMPADIPSCIGGPLYLYTGTGNPVCVQGHIYRAYENDGVFGWEDLTPTTSGAIISGAEIDTTVGDYRITYTSSGGLVVSGVGVALQVSSGGIVASADNGDEDIPESTVLIMSSGGLVADVFRNTGGVAQSKRIELTPDSLSVSGASGESVVLSGGSVSVNVHDEDAGDQYIYVTGDGVTINAEGPDRKVCITNGGVIGVEIGADYTLVNGRPVLTELATSTDSETTGAYFDELEGGTSVIYTQPLTALVINGITSDARAEFDFTAGAGFDLALPFGAKRFGVGTFTSGKPYLVTVNGNRVSAGEYSIDSQIGVWLMSGTSVVSAAAVMTGAVVSSGLTQFVYSRGVASDTLAVSGGHIVANSGAIVRNASAAECANAFAVSATGATVSGLNVWNASALLSNCNAENIEIGTDIGQYTARVSCFAGAVTRVVAGTKTIFNLNSHGSAGEVRISSGAYFPLGGFSYVGDLVMLGGGICSAASATIDNLIISGGGPSLSSGVVLNSITLTDLRGSIVLTGGNALDGWTVSNINIGIFNSTVCSGLTLDDTATCNVYNGGMVSAPVLLSGTTLTVASGGSAVAVTSNAGAVVIVRDGGYVNYVTQ